MFIFSDNPNNLSLILWFLLLLLLYFFFIKFIRLFYFSVCVISQDFQLFGHSVKLLFFGTSIISLKSQESQWIFFCGKMVQSIRKIQKQAHKHRHFFQYFFFHFKNNNNSNHFFACIFVCLLNIAFLFLLIIHSFVRISEIKLLRTFLSAFVSAGCFDRYFDNDIIRERGTLKFRLTWHYCSWYSTLEYLSKSRIISKENMHCTAIYQLIVLVQL